MISRVVDFVGENVFSAAGLTSFALNSVFGSRAKGKSGILTYHRISGHIAGLPEPYHNVTPERFESQIQGLLNYGFQIWPLSKLIESHAQDQEIPDKTIAVTFDDGYETVYTQAFPILRKLGQPASVFVCTDLLDKPQPFPFDEWGLNYHDRASAESYRSMGQEACRKLIDSGLIEIGSHTHSHGDFRGQPDEFKADLDSSIDFLETNLGLSNVAFAFPWGKVQSEFAGQELMDVVKQSRLSCALTTEPQLVDLASSPFGWGRYNVHSWDTAASLKAKLSGWYNWFPATKKLGTRIVRRLTFRH